MNPNTSIILKLIDKYGFSVVVAVVLLIVGIKLMKMLIDRMFKTVDDARNERQAITQQFIDATKSFSETLNKHLDDNTQTQERILVSAESIAQKCSNGFGDMKLNQKEILKETMKTRFSIQSKPSPKKRKKKS